MPPVNISCPKCTLAGTHAQMQTDGHKLSCTAGHVFEDSVELSQYGDLKPFAGEAFKPPPPQPPPNAVTFTIAIDSKLRDALTARFGDKVNENIVTILSDLTNKGVFIVPAEDAKRLSDLLKTPITASNVLYGNVYSIHKSLTDLQEEHRLLIESKKGGASSNGGGGLQVDFDIETLAKLVEKASFMGKSLRIYVKEQIEYCLQQGWL